MTASANTICVGEELIFNNNSTGTGNSYSWDFGDGANMGTANGNGPFTNSYSTSGTKTITLTASNSLGSDVSTIEVNVVAIPLPSFTYTANFGELIFTNTSTNSESFIWNFGDGNTSTEANPTHIYTQSGTYEITLLGQSAICDDVLFSQTVEVTLLAAPIAGLTASLSTICIGDEIVFENNSTGIVDDYNWSFGSGASLISGSQGGPFSISYSTSGIKTITLVTSNNTGSDMATIEVEVVAPPASVSYTHLTLPTKA